jgi:hypothetical protein
MALHHVLYCFSIIANFVTVSIYWPLLHENECIKHGKDPINGHGKVLHMYLVHSIPAVCCLLNTLITKTVMKRGMVKALLYFSIGFTALQFVVVKSTGRVLYFFLNFQDGLKTWIIVAGIVFGSSGVFLAFCFADEMLKGDLRKKKVEKKKDK